MARKILSKTFTCFLIFTFLLMQCPVSEAAEAPPSEALAESSAAASRSLAAASAAGSSSGGSSASLAPFQSEFYRTDLVTGTASLSLPIVVTPGRAGIQPNLALSYSSSGGNSWCGVGWNLDLGAIARDTRRGIPKYDNTDTIIASVSGANMKLVNIGGSEYRARIESAFMKFLYQENGDYWEVWDKSGTKYRFGYNSDSRVTNPKGTLSWSLDQVLDTNGNYMTISYTQDQGRIYPAQIEYTGNKNTGYIARHTVNFILEERNDLPSNYRSGYEIVTARRLKEIAAKIDNELVRRYVLDYDYSVDTNRSILTSVTEYGQDDTTPLPSVKTFTYSVRDSNPGGALYPDLVLDGGSLLIDGEKHFNSITLKNGAVLSCNHGLTGMTLIVDTFVNLESGSSIDLSGKGYAGGAGGAGGSGGPRNTPNCGGRGGQAGQSGEGPGAGSGGSGGGDGETWSITRYIQPGVILSFIIGSGGGGGGKGADVEDNEGIVRAAGGSAGTIISPSSYEQSSVHVGSGGAGGCGSGGGGSYATGNIAIADLAWFDGSDGNSGGDGGSGGSYLKISCKNLTIDNSCSISAKGEDGDVGGDGGSGWKFEDGSTGLGGGGGHGAGGGVGGGILLEVAGTLTNNGVISVNGGSGGPGGEGGKDAGESGLQGSGGSGGRIEVHYAQKEGSGTYSYLGGSGTINGNPGTLYEEQISQTNSISRQISANSLVNLNSASSGTGNHLWSICFVGQDRGELNDGPYSPFETDTVYMQSSFDGSVWWNIDSDGDIHFGGGQDHYICAWTYLYVHEAKAANPGRIRNKTVFL